MYYNFRRGIRGNDLTQGQFKEAPELCLLVMQILEKMKSPEIEIAKRDIAHIQSTLGEKEFKKLLRQIMKKAKQPTNKKAI